MTTLSATSDPLFFFPSLPSWSSFAAMPQPSSISLPFFSNNHHPFLRRAPFLLSAPVSLKLVSAMQLTSPLSTHLPMVPLLFHLPMLVSTRLPPWTSFKSRKSVPSCLGSTKFLNLLQPLGSNWPMTSSVPGVLNSLPFLLLVTPLVDLPLCLPSLNFERASNAASLTTNLSKRIVISTRGNVTFRSPLVAIMSTTSSTSPMYPLMLMRWHFCMSRSNLSSVLWSKLFSPRWSSHHPATLADRRCHCRLLRPCWPLRQVHGGSTRC